MTLSTLIFGLVCLVLGMACVLLTFLVFKPVLMDFYATLAAEAKRQYIENYSRRNAVNVAAVIEDAKGKSDRHGVVRPKNPNIEDVK